jgi:hypothetical protein
MKIEQSGQQRSRGDLRSQRNSSVFGSIIALERKNRDFPLVTLAGPKEDGIGDRVEIDDNRSIIILG